MQTLVIRPATPADIDAIADVVLRAKRANWHTFIAPEIINTPPKINVDATPTLFHLVAEINGHIVGTVSATTKSFKPYFADKGFAELATAYVDPANARHGIGRALFNAVCAELRARNSTKMVVGTFADNRAARHAYESWGFSPHPHTEYRPHENQTTVFLTLDIAPIH